jgi:hypothetical protein
MKIQTSKLCVNCESLYEGNGPCPFCRSEVFVWLFRALGTALEPNIEGNDNHTVATKEGPASRPLLHLSDSSTNSFGDTMMECRSFEEFRSTMGRLGREMVRVLTFGMIHACK